MRLFVAIAAALIAMPPTAGTMYNGNNSQAPNLTTPDRAPPVDQGGTTGTGLQSGQGNEAKSGGGN